MDVVAICWKPHDLLLPPYMPRTCCNTEKTDFKQQHCLYLPACLLDLYPILHGSLFQLSLPFLFGFCAVNLVSRQACYLLPICPAWRFTECPAEFSFSDHAAVHQQKLWTCRHGHWTQVPAAHNLRCLKCTVRYLASLCIARPGASMARFRGYSDHGRAEL